MHNHLPASRTAREEILSSKRDHVVVAGSAPQARRCARSTFGVSCYVQDLPDLVTADGSNRRAHACTSRPSAVHFETQGNDVRPWRDITAGLGTLRR